MRGGIFAAFALALGLLAAGAPLAIAQTEQEGSDPFRSLGESDEPALISADEITYDEGLGLVTASGNVEVSQGARVVRADTISFNQRTNVVTASGNVSLTEPSGDVIFADYAELTDDLREGFIRDIRILMTDRSRLAAVTGQRTGGNRNEMRKAVFSPCELCREDPTRAPLWQLKAERVVHDQEEKVVRYNNAWMEIFGIPVFYTPYFEHPDPTVERKSGFLSPTIATSDTLGATVQIPYYWTIGDDKDLTIAPIFGIESEPVLTAKYRQVFTFGELEVEGSGTVTERERNDGTREQDVLRGHIFASGSATLSETWRGGFDLERATDDTYLRLYDFSDTRTLTSSFYLEGLRGRNFAAVEGFAYQGLRATDIDENAPIALPYVQYSLVSEPGQLGGVYRLDASLLGISRIDGRDSRRVSLIGSWEVPYTSPIGDVYTLSVSVQTDGYWTDGFEPSLPGNVDPPTAPGDDFTGRVFPQIALQWRYPWVSHHDGFSQTIEPIAQIVASPNGSNPDEIPNEDSVDFEFDDTNLFSSNRFTGVDRVDSGSRVDYGLKYSLISEELGYTSFFVGQSYRFSESDEFAVGSGLEDQLSDIVGRVVARPIDELSLIYRFRLNKDTLKARRTEVDLIAGPRKLTFLLGYTFIAGTPGSGTLFPDREELRFGVRSRLSKHWQVFANHRRDLQLDASLSTDIGVRYHDECFLIEVVGERTNFRDREIETEDAIFLRVNFKHLGGLSSE